MNLTTTALARPEDQGDMLWDPTLFAHAHKVAEMFAFSKLVPEHMQGKDRIPDVLISLNIARRLGEDPLTVMQSIYIVKGKPGWSSAYLIARAARHGINVRWRVKRTGDAPIPYDRNVKTSSGWTKMKAAMLSLSVTAYATLPGETEPIEYEVTSQQAIAAGWADNEQYTHSAELMLRYRSATHLLRLYAPAILLGLPTEDEARQAATVEFEDVTPAAAPAKRGIDAIDAVIDPPIVEEPKVIGSAPNKGKPKPSPELDAQVLRQILGEAPEGTSLSFDVVRERFRAATGLARVSQERWDAAIDYGRGLDWFSYALDREGLMLAEAPETDPLPPEPVPKSEPASVDLMQSIAAFEADLDDDVVNEAATAAGLPLRDGEPYLDGAPTEALERYRAELEQRVQA